MTFAVALVTSVVGHVAAEEAEARCDACEAPAAEALDGAAVEATSPAPDVSEAPSSPAQGATPQNSERPPELAGPSVPAPAALPAPSAAAQSSALLGVHLPEFIAFGLGGLGAGGAVVTRLAATAPYVDPKLSCNGRCADGSHRLGMTSTLLAGLAVGAVGTGVVLVLSEPARERKPLAPVLKMSVSPSKAAASASWTF